MEEIRGRFSEITQQQVLYVGKHGSDTFDGKTLNRAKLTFGATITAAGTPVDESHAVTIKAIDDGTYDEDLNGVAYVNIFAPAASLITQSEMTEYESWRFRRIRSRVDQPYAVRKSGSGLSYLFADSLLVNRSFYGVYANEGDLHVTIGHLDVDKKITFPTGGIYLDTTAGTVVVNIGAIDVEAGALGLAVGYSRLVGVVGEIIGAGTGVYSHHGAARLLVGSNTATTAYEIDAVQGSIYLVCPELTGVESAIAGSDVRVTKARRDNYVATAAPGVGDDAADGYTVGSVWIDVTADDAHVCCDSSAGAAVWKKMTP